MGRFARIKKKKIKIEDSNPSRTGEDPGNAHPHKLLFAGIAGAAEEEM